jgi:hypothetical protein
MYVKKGALSWRAFDPDSATVLGYNPLTDCEAEPSPLTLGGKERRE